MERIFEEKIVEFVDGDLSAPGRAIEEYLEILEVAYDATLNLVGTIETLCKSFSRAPTAAAGGAYENRLL